MAASEQPLEIANAADAVQDGRIHIEKINGPFLFKEGASPAEYSAALRYAIDKGWLWLHESGTFVKFTPCGQRNMMRSSIRSAPNYSPDG